MQVPFGLNSRPSRVDYSPAENVHPYKRDVLNKVERIDKSSPPRRK